MANLDDARRIGLTLPGAIAASQGFALSVENKGKDKGFAWIWQERIHPKKPRVPQPKVLAVRVADELEKAALLAADPDKFFTEPHYNGFPAVLVRLEAVSEAELCQLLTEAWRCQAPALLVAAYDAGDPDAAADHAARPAAMAARRQRIAAAAEPAAARFAAAKATAARSAAAESTAAKAAAAKATAARAAARAAAKAAAAKPAAAKPAAAKPAAAKPAAAKPAAPKPAVARSR